MGPAFLSIGRVPGEALALPALLVALPLALLGASPAAAQQLDLSGGGPIDVTAQGGFEWRQQEQVVIASGGARAVRGDVTVLADRLVARYRHKSGDAVPVASAGPDTGASEVYRIEAEGNVRIATATDQAEGDRAVYDIDQAVLVMTGKALRLTTPQQVLTARDSMEYWSQKRMAVGRGNAVVVSADGRRMAADTLVGYTTAPGGPSGRVPHRVPGRPAQQAGVKPTDPILSSGKIERVEAFGNVEVRTAADIARGDRGVYSPDTGIARLVGHVRVTHGQNQLNGPAADVNMKTGIAHMLSGPDGRVQGLIMPNDVQGGNALNGNALNGNALNGNTPNGSQGSVPQGRNAPAGGTKP